MQLQINLLKELWLTDKQETVTINQSGFIFFNELSPCQEETRILSDWKLKDKDKLRHRISTK